jgi:hypothetical protein
LEEALDLSFDDDEIRSFSLHIHCVHTDLILYVYIIADNT